MEKFCKYCGKPLKERVACYDRELYCDCEQTQLANELGRKIRTTQNILNADIEDYEHMPYTSDKGKEFISLIKQKCIGRAIASSNAAAQLIKLGKPQPVSIFNN